MLCLFLDMGVTVVRHAGSLRAGGWFLLASAVAITAANAVLALAVARALGLPAGDAVLFTVLCASASYIAVPPVPVVLR